MNIRRTLAAAATIGGIATAGVAMASPASANIYQNGCQSSSYKIFTSSTGYCFNGSGDISNVGINYAHSFCPGSHDGSQDYTFSYIAGSGWSRILPGGSCAWWTPSNDTVNTHELWLSS